MNYEFSKRELEVLKYLVQGKSNIEIAQILGISKHTVKSHISSVLNNTNLKNRTQLAYLVGAEKYFDD